MKTKIRLFLIALFTFGFMATGIEQADAQPRGKAKGHYKHRKHYRKAPPRSTTTTVVVPAPAPRVVVPAPPAPRPLPPPPHPGSVPLPPPPPLPR